MRFDGLMDDGSQTNPTVVWCFDLFCVLICEPIKYQNRMPSCNKETGTMMFSPPAKVFAILVTLLFAVDNLDFSKPLDHFEAFSGDMSVTRAEWADARLKVSGL